MRKLIETFICDKCGLEKDCWTCSVPQGKYVGASGNTESRSIDFDLCADCTRVFLCVILGHTHADADYIKKMVPKARLID